MERTSDVLEVQHGECDNLLDDSVVTVDEWKVYELRLTKEKTQWLWAQIKRFPTLFADNTVDDEENLWRLVSSQNSYWLEVKHEGATQGVLYANSIQPGVDAEVHVIFFDRKVKDKVEICKAVVKHLIKLFHLHRISTNIPRIYFSTVALAKGVGFVKEGVRLEVYPIGGRWVDEIVMGLLASKV